MSLFGKRLRLARKASGLSLCELAESVPAKINAIRKYETGKALPSSALLVDIAKALDVPIDFLMGEQVEEVVWHA